MEGVERVSRGLMEGFDLVEFFLGVTVPEGVADLG